MRPLNLVAGGNRATELEMLRNLVAEQAFEADTERKLSQKSVFALQTAGFSSHFVPGYTGGRGSRFAALLTDVQSLAGCCASTAWCATIYAVAGRMAAYLPLEGQSEIWAKAHSSLISASFRPSGAAITSDGGWRLSGDWHYLSGITYADWALICFVPQDGSARYAAIPASEFTIVDAWSTLGMRGTGSHGIHLVDVFVPSHRTFAKQDLWGGRATDSTGVSYQVSPVDSDPPLFAGVALGTARSAISLWASEWHGLRPDSEIGIAYARSLAELDAANLLLERACQATDSGSLALIEAGRNGRDASLAIEHVLSAVGRIFRLGGSQAHFEYVGQIRWQRFGAGPRKCA